MRCSQPLVMLPCKIHTQACKEDKGVVKIVEKPGNGPWP
jgi:hypothetical protein